MPDRLLSETVDPALQPGAHNAVHTCLRLQPSERITIITDEATRDIAAALEREVIAHGSEYSIFVLERYAHPSRSRGCRRSSWMTSPARRCPSLPPSPRRANSAARIEMTSVVNAHKIRHGHMVNINRQIMLEGMRADFLAVDALSQRLVERAATGGARHLPHGARDRLRGRPVAVPALGQDQRHHLARRNGATCPAARFSPRPSTPTARFVVDGVVGDYLCQKYGDLQATPLTIEVKDNRIVDLRSENHELLEEFRAYTSTDENSNRVGEFAIGTNMACTHVIGHILQDEKIPGRPHRLRSSLRRAHRPDLALQDPHRLRGPRLRHLVRRRERSWKAGSSWSSRRTNTA